MTSADGDVARTIGFDGSRLTGRPLTGTETYSFELLRRLASIAEPGELVVYLNDRVVPAEMPEGPFYRPIAQQRLWTHTRLAREVQAHPPGALFVPAHVIPIRHPKSVVTIHDIAYRAVPKVFSRKERKELDSATRWNCRAAEHLIAVSQQTRSDLIDQYGIDPARVSVIYHGVDSRFRAPSTSEQDVLRERYGLHRPYILTLGTLHRRKNLDTTIRAFEVLRDRGHDIDLVLAGAAGPAADAVKRLAEASPHSSSIRLPGYVPLEDVPALYGTSDLFMLLSWYEGFGLPALEAMACGAPVVAAGSGALPEVCGPAARFAAPGDLEEVITVAEATLTSSDTRQRMIDAGRVWSGRFTWERAARTTLRVLRAVRDGEDLRGDSLGWSEAAMAFLSRELEQTG
ncbi:MAG: glycosyltransferase family 4 protein [Thermomicrobiales bacterium]